MVKIIMHSAGDLRPEWCLAFPQMSGQYEERRSKIYSVVATEKASY